MKTSKKGLDLIKKFEGCRLKAYKCPAGVFTIGYGHTKGVKAGLTITQDQAEDFLLECMAVVVDSIDEVWEYFEEEGLDMEGADKEEILEAAYGSLEYATPSYSFLPKTNGFYTEDLEKFEQDLEASKSLIAGGATKLSLCHVAEPAQTAQAQVIQAQLKEVGIEVENVRYITSQAWPFPDQLMLAFKADYKKGKIQPQEEEIEEAMWFKRDELPAIPKPGSVAWKLIMGEL